MSNFPHLHAAIPIDRNLLHLVAIIHPHYQNGIQNTLIPADIEKPHTARILSSYDYKCTRSETERIADTDKRWEDNIREWTGVGFAKSQRAVENGKMEKTGCEIICGVPTTLAVKG